MIKSIDLREGPAAATNFQNAMRALMSVPHTTIQKRLEEHRAEAAMNPNRRGPKKVTK